MKKAEKKHIVRNLMNNFRRIVRALRSSHRAAGHLNLTGAQLFILKVLGEAGRAMGISEVARATETTQSTASVVTARLVERGLVVSERSTSDARRAELSLTARGRAMHRKSPAPLAQLRLTEALKGLSAGDAAKLDALLEKIVDHMGIGGEPPGMLFDDYQARPPRRALRSGQRRAG